MASINLMETKDGRRFFLIRVSRGMGHSFYQKRWYWPDGWARKTAEREARKVAAEFERACAAGEILNRDQAKEKAALETAEAAKLKTVRQYAEGVFMPTKEATLTENSRSTYQMFMDRHILPTIGDLLLVDVTPAIIQKLLLDFQKSGKAHATAVKLYNILNGLFSMAFMDDSIPISPMLKVKRPAPRKDEAPPAECSKAMTVQELRFLLSRIAQEPLNGGPILPFPQTAALAEANCAASNGQTLNGNLGVLPFGGISSTHRRRVCILHHQRTEKSVLWMWGKRHSLSSGNSELINPPPV